MVTLSDTLSADFPYPQSLNPQGAEVKEMFERLAADGIPVPGLFGSTLREWVGYPRRP